MYRKVLDFDKYLPFNGVDNLEKDFTSSIVKNYRKTFNNSHLDSDPTANINGSISTQVYDDGLVVILDPVSQKLSFSFDGGSSWVKYPIPTRISEFVRVGKESFVFKNIDTNTLFYTFDMFETTVEIQGTDGLILSSSTYVSASLFATNVGIYKVNNVDTKDMVVIYIDGGCSTSYIFETYNKEVFYLKDNGSTITINQIIVGILNYFNIYNIKTLNSADYYNTSNSAKITQFGVSYADGSVRFLFTTFDSTINLGVLCHEHVGGWYNFNYPDVLFIDFKVVFDVAYIFFTNKADFSTVLIMYEYNPNAGFDTPFMGRTVYMMNGIQRTYINLKNRIVDSQPWEVNPDSPFVDDSFDDGSSISVKSLSYSNGYLYISNNQRTYKMFCGATNITPYEKITGDQSYMYLWLDMYFNPGDIGGSRLVDVYVNKFGVSLITLDDSTAVSPNPLDGFVKVHYPSNTTIEDKPTPFATIVPWYPDNVQAWEYMSINLPLINNGNHQAVIQGETINSSREKVVWIKNNYTNIGSNKYNVTSYLWYTKYSELSNWTEGGSYVVEWNNFIGYLLAACDIGNDDFLIFELKKFNDTTIDNHFDNQYFTMRQDFEAGVNFRIEVAKFHKDNPNVTTKLFDITFPNNSNSFENCKISKISFLNNSVTNDDFQIVVYFNNRHPILIDKNLNGYTDIIIPGYEDYIVNGIEYICPCEYKYVVSVGKIRPITSFSNVKINSKDRVVSNLLLSGSSLKNLKPVITDGRITSVRHDIWRNLIYVVHLDRFEIYDEALNFIKSYDVGFGTKPMVNVTINPKIANKVDHEKLRRAIVCSGLYRSFDSTKTLNIDSIIENRSMGDDISCIITVSSNGTLESEFEATIDFSANTVCINDDITNNEQFTLFGQYTIYTMDQPSNKNFIFFQNEDFYGNLSIGMRCIGVSSKAFPADITYSPLDPSQNATLTGDTIVLIYKKFILIYSSYSGYLSIYSIDSAMHIQPLRINVSVGPNNTFGSFIVDEKEGFAYIPNSSNFADGIYSVNINGLVNATPKYFTVSNVPMVGNLAYNLKKYRGKIYGSFTGVQNGLSYNYIGIVEDINSPNIIVNVIPSTITRYVSNYGLTCNYNFDIVDDVLFVNNGIVFKSFKFEDIFGGEKYVTSMSDTDYQIQYKKIDNSSPISINTQALNDSINRNFDVSSKSYIYDLTAAFLKTSGVLRDYGADRMYDLKEILDEFIMISDTYTGKKRIDIGMSSTYLPSSVITTDAFTVNVDASVQEKVSTYLRHYDNGTLHSIFSFMVTEKRV